MRIIYKRVRSKMVSFKDTDHCPMLNDVRKMVMM